MIDQLNDVVNDYISNTDAYTDNTVIAINKNTKEIVLDDISFVSPCDNYDIYPIDDLFDNNMDINYDFIYEIASTFFFVR